MDVECCTTGSTVKTGNSLIPVQQNVRGTVSKRRDIIVLGWIKLTLRCCFTEHHTSHGNLCLTNIENYELGSISLDIIKVELEFFLRKEIHFSSLGSF